MRRASGLFRRKSRANEGPPPEMDDEPGDADPNPLIHQLRPAAHACKSS